MNKQSFLILIAMVGVMVVAIGCRFYDIQNYPPGLFPDEAANGEDALLVLDGDVRPFYPRGNGREGLFFMLEAASIWLFGKGVWQLHMVSAVIGVLTVLAMYFATRVWFGRLAGFFAALWLATNHWHVTLSRTGFRAILLPLFVALFTAWVGYVIQSVKKGEKKKSLVYAVLAGAALAGGFYTYIAYRIMVGVILGIAGLMLLAALHPKIGWPHGKRYRWQLVVGALAAAIVLAPLGWFFVNQPEAFVGRAGQVSVFNPDLQREYGEGTLWGTLLYTTRETVTSFFSGSGDLNWRHNVAGFPLLNPLVGVMGLLGLVWAIWGFVMVIKKIVNGVEVHMGMIYAYLLLLLGGLTVPVITTAEGMPHGLRSIGLVVPIFMLAGAAAAVVVHWGIKKTRGQVVATGVWYGAVVGLVVLGVFYDGALYFLVARNDAGAYYAYRADLTTVSNYINDYMRDSPGATRPYLVLDDFSVQTVHFLTSVVAHDYTVGDEVPPDEAMHKWELLDPARSHETKIEPGEIIIFTQSTMVDADRYAKVHPEVKIVEQRFNRFGQEIMRVYGVANEMPRVKGSRDGADDSFDLDA